ncbi:hypothetical protein X963_2118 [Burkholderia pseudomallei MSHR7498]|nr:hypothetical protein EGY16_10775 [Burkholderia pseudomallei]KGS96560.1 hypothetical protein X963_2118 [Burkholderia pseudomallei MSHR7498]
MTSRRGRPAARVALAGGGVDREEGRFAIGARGREACRRAAAIMPRVGATALLAEPACDEPRLGIFPLRFTLPSNFVERRIFSYPNPCDGPIGK